jgi:ketosteroid isomerase-like protein
MPRLFPFFLFVYSLVIPWANAQAGNSVAGTWFGHFIVTNTNGKISHDTAVLVVNRVQSAISGSIGPSIDQQMVWSGGSFESNQLKFHLESGGGMEIVMTLRNGALVGTAKGERMKAQIDVRPAPGLLPHAKLLQEILMTDEQLFEAFQKCDVKRYIGFLSRDIEFYQDRTGKTGYYENAKSLADRCAEGIKLRREIEPDATIVNAVPGFGAIQAGLQRFYSIGQDGKEHLDATARFTNLWREEDGGWKLVRVISYDHR